MFQSWFSAIKIDRRAAYFKAIVKLEDNFLISRDSCRLAWANLHFYPNYTLLQAMRTNTVPVTSHYYLYSLNDVFALEHSASSLMEANRRIGLQLTEESVLSYFIFFCAMVSTPAERVIPLTAFEAFPEAIDDKEKRDKLVSLIRDPSVKNLGDGAFQIYLPVIFGRDLVQTQVRIEADGRVEATQEAPLMTDLFE